MTEPSASVGLLLATALTVGSVIHPSDNWPLVEKVMQPLNNQGQVLTFTSAPCVVVSGRLLHFQWLLVVLSKRILHESIHATRE